MPPQTNHPGRRPPRPQMPRPLGPLGPSEWRQVEPSVGRRLTSLTVKVDCDVLLVARMRALFEGTSLSRLVRATLDQYATEAMRRFRSDPALWGSEDQRRET